MRARDELALPPVPPPAPAFRPRDLVVTLGFCVALVLPVIFMLALPARDTLVFENRLSAPWPAWSRVSDWRAFASGVEKAFGDRFGGRTMLVRAHHALKAVVFRTSPVPNVMIARDGWLFFLGEDGQALDRHYRGTRPFADAEVDAVVREFKRRQAWLAARGIPYVVTIVPDKFTLYPEPLPWWVTRTARTPLDRLGEALRADGEVRFVDLRPPLRAAKSRDLLYYKTDSHWNLLGALVAYDAIMDAVVAALPPALRPDPVYSPRRPQVRADERYTGDLSNMLGLPRLYREDDVAPLGRMLGETAPERCAKQVYVTPGPFRVGFRERYECPGRKARLLMLRDSMAIPLVPLIAENFAVSLFVTDRLLDPKDVEEIRPDVVVEEMVERTFSQTAARPMP